MIGLIGRGGMGEVYRATDLTLGQSVALKILPANAAANEGLLERFHNEVRIARQVSHPNVCRVYDIGEADGLPFISMEFVDGEDLASLLKRIGRLPSDKALEITRKICAGLASAHERGIIHRDLKPHNVMLNRRGEVVIMDFGLAAVADELQGTEARSGTPAYQSPEQLRGASVTARSDIYALGLIAYELFTGRRAFDANSVSELIRMQETGRPPSISSVAADVDPTVENVILRCLQSDPAQRPQTPLAVAAALPGGDPLAAALAAGETPSPELVAASGKTEGFALRYAVPMLALVLIGALALPLLMQSMSVLALAPMDLSPAVLEQKARETAAALGYTAKPADWHSWLENDADLLTYHESKGRTTKSWQQLLGAESPVSLTYRESRRYLLSPPDGSITKTRPPFDLPGMLLIQVNSRAQLREFQAIVPREDPTAVPAQPTDPGAVFRMAGFDLAQFKEVAPTYAPPLAFDTRQAWSGQHPGLQDVPVTIEMATWKGKVTSFHIRWPWTKPVTGAEEPRKATDIALTAFTVLFAITGLFCAIFFAHKNLSLGRGDRAGGLRIAAFSLLIFFVSWAARVHVVPRVQLLGYAFEFLSIGVTIAGLLWLLYQALEPAVRARWPHSLVTWNRLLAGQFVDPRVGSHILIGTVVGVAMHYMFIWRLHFLMKRGGAPDIVELNVLMGVRPLFATLMLSILGAIQVGAVIFFLLCGVRALVRRDWVATVTAALVLAVQQGSVQRSETLALDLTLIFIAYSAFAFVLLRMGLVPALVGIFVINTLGRVPVAADFSSWMNPVAATQVLTVVAIAIYGFWRSQTRSVSPARAGL